MRLSKKLIIKSIPAFFFILLSVFLILSWFRYGQLYGGGDVGLQIYNPVRILENARYIWWEVVAPGTPIPQGLTAVPFQFFLSIFQFLGFPPFALQAITFFVLLFLMGFGMYLFLRNFSEDKNDTTAAVGGLFYMLNPYMMIQVWHRFVHTTMFLAAALPFFGLFWNDWIRKGKFLSLSFFLLTAFFAVYAFGTFAFIITVWIFLFLLTLIHLLSWRSKRYFFAIIAKFLFGFIVWLFINGWWMMPVFKISPATLVQQHKTEESVYTLIQISAQEILPYSLRLINPFYLYQQAELGTIYQNFIFQLIPWLFTAIIFGGFILTFKNKKLTVYPVLFLISLLLAKGASPPFGNLYIEAFTRFFPLGVMRNPFEKSGLILVFFSTILFVVGFNFIYLSAKKNNVHFQKIIVLLVALPILIFAWPMFLGKIFGKIDNPSFVKVPESYKKADEFLLDQKAKRLDGKILHLPLPKGESVRYKWEFGYNGLDTSDTLFTSHPSISRAFNMKRVDDALSSLSAIFDKRYFDKEVAIKYLQDFNVRFIILHKDLDWENLDLYDPEESEKILNDFEFVHKYKEIGDLVIYQVRDEYFQPKVSIHPSFNLIYSSDESQNKPYFLNGSLMLTPVEEVDETIKQKADKIIIFPKNSFKYGLSSESAQLSEDILVKQLEEYKINLDKMGFILSKGLTERIIKASKILFEDSPKDINQYQELIKQIFHQDFDKSRFASLGEESILSTIFRFHFLALSQPQAKQLLIQEMTANNLLPQHPMNDNLKRQFFKFNIPAAGTYTFETLNQSFFEGFTVNGDKTFQTGEPLNLEQGDLEISFPTRLSLNLAPSLDQLKVSQRNGKNYIEVPITNLSFGGTYSISLYVKSDQQANLRLMLYETSKKDFNFTGVTSAERNLLVYPQIPQFLVNFEMKPSTKTAIFVVELPIGVNILDVKVQRILDDPLILVSTRRENPVEDKSASFKLNYESPILYRGSIKIDQPSFLFFKETFHPGWKLSLNKDGQEVIPKQHLLANLYGNAWYLENVGEYDFKIEFEMQKYVYIGILFSIGGLVVLGMAFITRRRIIKI